MISFPEAWLDRSLKDVRRQVVGDIEKAYLEEHLRQAGGKIGETAKKAGIELRSLYDKMRRYGLAKEDFKPRKDD